ncbi:MAG TPA: hypothetical protein VNO26_09030, partial [Candidatus Limnocylindria bacterium]|nr:hypothetical protein [Candidatus Limnocylindria bacterium]
MRLGATCTYALVLAALVLPLAGAAGAADDPPPDLLCYAAPDGPGARDTSVETADRFGARTARL